MQKHFDRSFFSVGRNCAQSSSTGDIQIYITDSNTVASMPWKSISKASL